MAHYAFIDENYKVVEVIVGKDESNFDWERHYGDIRGMLCKRTSRNTFGGIHVNQETGLPSEDQSNSFRKNFAGIGYTYDAQLDAFIPPKPFNSWTLDEDTCLWNPPVSAPTDGGFYNWDEASKQWILIKQEQV